jgi:hypothetical protein
MSAASGRGHSEKVKRSLRGINFEVQMARNCGGVKSSAGRVGDNLLGVFLLLFLKPLIFIPMIADTTLVHHVFFWLKNPDSKEDLNALLDGIKGLGEIPQVQGVHVAVPAATEQRGVVDGSYSASEILLFKSLEDQATYQSHPLHQAFIAAHSDKWAKVVVYDAVKAR